MKRSKNFFSLWSYLVLIILCPFVFFQHNVVAQSCECDVIPPILTITDPATGGSYVTDRAVVNLAGEVSDEIGVKQVTWSNNRGGYGTAVGTTNWIGPWHWKVKGIPLSENDNLITITATDAVGNEADATLMVTYNPPPPPAPPSSEKEIDNKKAKFTFYFGGPDYDGIDRFSIVAYLLKEPDEKFVMPSEKNVTVTVRVPDPHDPSGDLQIFTQTVPAGTVISARRYRYTSGLPGIRELRFQERNSTSVYMYLFVKKVDFLSNLKASMTPEEYWEFVKGISNYKVTVQIGDKAWIGDAPLMIGSNNEHKQELVYNR